MKFWFSCFLYRNSIETSQQNIQNWKFERTLIGRRCRRIFKFNYVRINDATSNSLSKALDLPCQLGYCYSVFRLTDFASWQLRYLIWTSFFSYFYQKIISQPSFNLIPSNSHNFFLISNHILDLTSQIFSDFLRMLKIFLSLRSFHGERKISRNALLNQTI